MVKKNHHCGGPMPDDITCRLNVNSDTRVYSIGFPICIFIILHIFQKYNPYILCFAPLITLPVINKRSGASTVLPVLCILKDVNLTMIQLLRIIQQPPLSTLLSTPETVILTA